MFGLPLPFAEARVLNRLLPLLLLVTGMTGLCYEVVLSRLLALHLGSSGASQAVTLAAFLGGLALGAVLAGRAADGWLGRWARPTLAYAALEAGIALWMLVFPAVADAVFGAFGALAADLEPGSPATVVLRLTVAAVLVLPLSSAMGATLPVLAAGVERMDPAHGVQLVSRYYYLNAAGAAVGAGLAGFVLIEQFGLELPLTLGAMLNLAVAGLVYLLAKHALPVPALDPTTPVEARIVLPPDVVALPVPQTTLSAVQGDSLGLRPLLLAAWATGFVSLCCEIVWTRLGGLLLGASVYAFAAMLCIVIAGISAGSALATAAIARGRRAAHVLAFSQAVAAAATFVLVARLDDLPIDLLGLRTRLAPLPENYSAWLIVGGGFVALHLLPAAMALGAAFPALLAAARDAGVRTDRATAWILASNTTGNLMGALTGGFFLMPLLGLEYALLLGGVLSLLVAVAVLPRPRAPRLLVPLVALGLAALVTFVLAPPDPDLAELGLFRQRPRTLAEIPNIIKNLRAQQHLFREDGKDASILVSRAPNGSLVFRTNGKTDGSTGDTTTQIMLGHLGFLFAPAARDVFVVGLGTGQTAAALASHPGVRVTVAELTPAVVTVARLFAPYNHSVLDNKAVRVVVADAREVLRSVPPASLDLVVSEPSNPWVVGVADLYTVEHFQRVRERLRPGGVLVQWIHTYEISNDTLRAILCTMHQVFPHVHVFRMGSGDLALVGAARELALDVAAAERVLAEPSVAAELASHTHRAVPTSLDHWLVTQLCGPSTVNAVCARFAAPLQERFPRVEYDAPRDFFAATQAERLVGRLDTRVGAAPADTVLAGLVQSRPLDAQRRASLHAFLLAGDQVRERLLVAALGPQSALPIELAGVLDALPEPATLTPQRLSQYCAWLREKALWVLERQQTQLGAISERPAVLAWRAACRKP